MIPRHRALLCAALLWTLCAPPAGADPAATGANPPAAPPAPTGASATLTPAARPAAAKPAANAAGASNATSPNAASPNAASPKTAAPKAAASKAAKPAAKDAPEGYNIEPAPRWVNVVAVDPAAHVDHAPMHYALYDEQVRLGHDGVEHYVHKIRVINETAGLTTASQIQIDFDPSYQKLVMHDISIWRDGRRIDQLAGHQIRLLHRETQLEAQVYDGRMTASRVLDDLRVGDRIEWSYSLRGANPVFGDRFVDWQWSANSSGPAVLFQYRLVAPEGRTIHVQADADRYQVSTQVQAGMRETVIRRRDVHQFDPDPTVPPKEFLPDQIILSEFADWAEVATWARQLFSRAQETSPELLALVEQIRHDGATPEDRVRLALDFVQKQIRYFGTELGEYSHQPASPAKVFAQRFGDCKDKVNLLLAMLRELGIEGEPALVSTYFDTGVEGELPSPLAFNHAIARVRLGEHAYWLDGTRAYQTGALEGRSTIGLGRALVAAEGSSALTPIPDASAELRSVTETRLHVVSFPADPVLEVQVRFLGEMAESVRAIHDNRPADEFEKAVFGEWSRIFPGGTRNGEVTLTEDPAQNAVTVAAAYTVPDYWRYPEPQRTLTGNYGFLSTMSLLRLPNQAPRTHPLRLNLPGVVRETFVFDFPLDTFGKPGSSHFDERNKYFHFHTEEQHTAREARFTSELQAPLRQIETADWKDYIAQLNKVWPHFSGSISVPAMSPARAEALKQSAKTLIDDIVARRLKVPTTTQGKARFGLLALDAQLGEDRLPPRLRAEALVSRGQDLDFLGHYEDARRDFLESVRLDPKSVPAYNSLAANSMFLGRFDEMDTELARVLELAPSDTEARYTRMFSSYLRGDFARSRDESLDLLKDTSEADRSYAGIFLLLSTRRLGGDGAAAVQDHLPSASEPAWPFPVLRLLRGEVNLDQAEKAAVTDEGKPSPEKLCELYYYAGQGALLDGDRKGALRLLRRAVDTSVTEFNEYAFARMGIEEIERAKH